MAGHAGVLAALAPEGLQACFNVATYVQPQRPATVLDTFAVLPGCLTGKRACHVFIAVARPSAFHFHSMAHHQILIVGGGAAGLTVASQLKRARPGLEIAILEPSPDHYYQPGWTLVGAGVFTLEQTRRA